MNNGFATACYHMPHDGLELEVVATVGRTELPFRTACSNSRARSAERRRRKKGKPKSAASRGSPAGGEPKPYAHASTPRSRSSLVSPTSSPPLTRRPQATKAKAARKTGGRATTGETRGAKARFQVASWCDNLAAPPRVLIAPP
jgi:hypothetical protein